MSPPVDRAATAAKKPNKAVRPARKVAGRGNDTAEKIVIKAIQMFNRYGVQKVSVDRIAAELGISPGNLTYHFNRKNDLIRATLGVLQDNLKVALERPTNVSTAADGAAYLLRIFKSFWQFRFFFNSLAHLLQDDRQLRREYEQLREWVIATIETDIELLIERGYFLPVVAPNSVRLLAENIWSLFLNWLRSQQIQSPSARIPENRALYDIAMHHWSLCHHWMRPQYATELHQVIEQLLLPAKRKPA